MPIEWLGSTISEAEPAMQQFFSRGRLPIGRLAACNVARHVDSFRPVAIDAQA